MHVDPITTEKKSKMNNENNDDNDKYNPIFCCRSFQIIQIIMIEHRHAGTAICGLFVSEDFDEASRAQPHTHLHFGAMLTVNVCAPAEQGRTLEVSHDSKCVHGLW